MSTAPFSLQFVPQRELSSMVPPSRTALLVVDVQEDFASPAGAMGKAGLDLSRIEATIDRIETLIAQARTAGVTVVFARVVTREETDTSALKSLWVRKGRPGGHAICRASQSGSSFYRVQPGANDIEIQKTLFSCFHGTRLDEMLREKRIENLVVCGLTTDCCVDSTVRDGFHRDYHCFVVGDACAAYDDALHTAILAGLSKNCALLTQTEDVISAWDPEHRTAIS